MRCAIQTPVEIVELEEPELRRIISLARYGLQQKKILNLPMSQLEQKLEVVLQTELNF